MFVNLPDPSQFNIKDVTIAGDECVLITPKDMGVEWNDENKIFRSSIWRKSDGELISAGFKKFVNYLEKPEFEPLTSHERLEARIKLDGSCLIVNRYKGKLIVRTRGTIDATKLENGYEIAHLILKYPKAFDENYFNTENITLLFEWTTPTNRIVLKETEEPTLWLIGAVVHNSSEYVVLGGVDNKYYYYYRQDSLDIVADQIEVNRPRKVEFLDNETLDEFKSRIEKMEDIEGVVVYDSSNQILKKIKTQRYLRLHRIFTGIKTVNHLFDLFVEYGCLDRENFEALLATNYDWELVESLKTLMDELYSKWNEIKIRIDSIRSYLNDSVFNELDRKSKAQKILEIFSDCSGVAFAIMDNKEIAPEKLWKTFIKS